MMDSGTKGLHISTLFNRTIEGPKSARKPKRPSPITLRLTAEERQKLEELAQSMTLSAYIRMCVFQDEVAPRKSSNRAPVKDHEALAQVLGILGQSRIANNLNQLAKEAHLGCLLLDEQTEQQINDTYLYVLEIRKHLIAALGLKA